MLAKKLLGAAAAAEPLYIEDVFSTYLYTGTGANLTINNGIDLSGEGGLLWIKNRNVSGRNHALYDSARGSSGGIYKWLASNLTDAQSSSLTYGPTSFNSNGFTLGGSGSFALTNVSGDTYASWTFRKAEKFFDVVTYTGDGSSSRSISHNLGSVPGCIIVKRTNTASDWAVRHRSLPNLNSGGFLRLNTTEAEALDSSNFTTTNPTSSVFYVGNNGKTNGNGDTYVAYLFAHDAGGFGDDGEQNVISCGSFTGTGSLTSVNLGWEPQWVLFKRSSGATDNWRLLDNMRGWTNAEQLFLFPNTSGAESSSSSWGTPTATGMDILGSSGDTYIYIAIRRGPMKTPEVGTEVFSPVFGNGSGTIPNFQSNFVTDAGWMKTKNNTSNIFAGSRLQGAVTLFTNLTNAEAASAGMTWDSNSGWGSFGRNSDNIGWSFRRAPGFFDVVCYTGTGVARTVNHNLGVAPELMIVKKRSTTGEWVVYYGDNTSVLRLRLTNAKLTLSSYWNNTSPTESVFTVGNDSDVNASGATYVSYLFSSVNNVSKVGTYSGTGTTNQINCGFTNGARFVLIKRIDSTGDWYVWDTARGIVAGNDPYLLLNSTAAEVTNTDYVDTYSAGFEISSTAPAAINASGGSFMFLAIA